MELKECPFCGGTNIRIDKHPPIVRPVFSMCCYDCGATFPNRYRRELLVDAWNRRALLPDKGEQMNEEIKEELLQALEGAAYFMLGMCHDPAVKNMQKEALTDKGKELLAIVEKHLDQ